MPYGQDPTTPPDADPKARRPVSGGYGKDPTERPSAGAQKSDEQPSSLMGGFWKFLTDPKGGLEAAQQGVIQGVEETGRKAARLAAMAPSPFGNLLPGARAGQERMIADAQRRLEEGQKAFEAQPAVQEHPNIAAGGRIGGNIVGQSPLALVPGGAAGMATRAAAGAIPGAISGALEVSPDDDFWTKAKKLALGAGTGAVTGGAFGAGAPRGGAVTPGATATQRGTAAGTPGGLIAGGVSLTPGMQLGPQARGVEQYLKGFPILSGMIQRGEARSLDGFNRATANQVLEPIGGSVPKSVRVGHDMVKYLKAEMDDGYDKILPQISFNRSEWDNLINKDPKTGKLISPSDPKLNQLLTELPDDLKERLTNILNNRVSSRFQGGILSGRAYKDAMSELGDRAGDFGKHTNQAELGNAIDEITSRMRASMVSQNPTYAKQLRDIDTSYAMFTRYREAANALTAHEGMFTPQGLRAATRRLDETKGHGAFAGGDALLQSYAESAEKTLGKVTPPGTTVPSRALAHLGTFIGGMGGVEALHTLAPGALPYAGAAAALPYAARAGMSAAARAGRAPPGVSQAASTAAGSAAARQVPDRRKRIKAAAKIGELKNQLFLASRGDLGQYDRLRQRLADAQAEYQSLA